MSRGQVPVGQGDRVIARALGVEDPQLVADVVAVLGRAPSYADVMRACHSWGTDATGALLWMIEDAYDPMPPEGWGLTKHTAPRGRRTTPRRTA